MALFEGSIRSQALRMDTRILAFLPAEENLKDFGGDMKTVILLHGLRQNADSWVRLSRVCRFAARTGFNVIMPEVQRSWYADMTMGLDL